MKIAVVSEAMLIAPGNAPRGCGSVEVVALPSVGVPGVPGDAVKHRAMGAPAHQAVRARTWPVGCDRLVRGYHEAAHSGVPRGF